MEVYEDYDRGVIALIANHFRRYLRRLYLIKLLEPWHSRHPPGCARPWIGIWEEESQHGPGRVKDNNPPRNVKLWKKATEVVQKPHA